MLEDRCGGQFFFSPLGLQMPQLLPFCSLLHHIPLGTSPPQPPFNASLPHVPGNAGASRGLPGNKRTDSPTSRCLRSYPALSAFQPPTLLTLPFKEGMGRWGSQTQLLCWSPFSIPLQKKTYYLNASLCTAPLFWRGGVCARNPT